MSKKAVWGRWSLAMLAVLAPILAVAAYACVRWGQLALDAVQVVMKLAVIP